MSSFPSKGAIFLVLAVLFGVGCQSSGPDAPAYQFVEAWGGPGSKAGQFQDPIGIETVGSEVFVSEAGNHRVQVLGRQGEGLRRIGPAIGNGDTLRRPMHVAAGESALYVPDFNTDRIHVFFLNGEYRRSLDGSDVEGGFDAPGGVAVDPQGRLYVADFYHHRVLRFRPDDTFERQWGIPDSTGKAPNRFTYPTDVALLPDGGFVVADAYNHRIKRYNADGSLAWMRPKDPNAADSTKGTFNVATAVAVGPDGHIFVADFYNHRIQVFSLEGAFLTAFGEQGNGEGQFERPVDVAVDAEGILHVVDFGNDRLQTFRRPR